MIQLSIQKDFAGGGFNHAAFEAELEVAGVELGSGRVYRHGDLVRVDAVDDLEVRAIAAAHTGAALSEARLATLARSWSGDASTVDWRNLAHVLHRPVASVVFDLDATITRIDWLNPAGTLQPVDPYGERIAGDVVVREERTETEGPLGPATRSYAFTAFRQDGTVYQVWSTPVEHYAPAIQAQRGQQRRDRAIQRVSGWLAAALGGVQPLQAWTATKAEALTAFRDLAEPSPLIAAVTTDPTPVMDAAISTFGIDLVTNLDPTTTLRGALLAVLQKWS